MRGPPGSLLVLFLALSFAACKDKRPPELVTVVKSPDGDREIAIPKGWKEDKSLHAKADIQVADPPDEMYALVLTDTRERAGNMDLVKYSEATRDAFMKSLVGATYSPARNMMVNGYPAIEREIRGSVQNLDVVYLHTIVETPHRFHQVMAWTLKAQWEKNKDTLEAVTESFRDRNP
jgi:hypothetical protein